MEFATIVKFALPFLKDFGTELLANLVVCSLLPLFKKQKKEKNAYELRQSQYRTRA